MKHSSLFFALAILTIGASGATIGAYLSPEEVFSDLDVSRQGQSSSSQSEAFSSESFEEESLPEQKQQQEVETVSERSATSSAPSEEGQSSPQSEAASSESSENFEEDTFPEQEQEQVTTEQNTSPPSEFQAASSTSSAPEPASPVFYRTGKKLEITEEMQQQSSRDDSPFDDDNENKNTDIPSQTGATTVPVTETASGTVTEDDADTPPEEEQVPVTDTEPLQPAAPSGLSFIRLLGASSYYVVGFAVLLAAGLYVFLRKKPKAEKAPGNMPLSKISADPEESSPRLEQALKAMEAEGITEAANRLKEIQHPEQ